MFDLLCGIIRVLLGIKRLVVLFLRFTEFGCQHHMKSYCIVTALVTKAEVDEKL